MLRTVHIDDVADPVAEVMRLTGGRGADYAIEAVGTVKTYEQAFAMIRRGGMLSVDDVLDLLAIDLIGVIPEDENVIVASNRGQPLALDPKNRAGQAFQNIARRLMGERVPFLDLNPQNMFQRILGRR